MKKNNLKLILYGACIILISLISFVGIYAKSKNTTINKVKEYALDSDINSEREIIIKVDKPGEVTEEDTDETSEETEEKAEEVAEENEKEKVDQEESIYTAENYKKAKKIIESRLNFLQLDYYEISCNEDDGTITIKVPEDEKTDYVSQYSVTTGEFKISDNDTDEMLINNSHIKSVKIASYAQESGTLIYLDIQLNNEGKEILKNISNTYKGTSENPKADAKEENDDEELVEDEEEAVEGEESTEAEAKEKTNEVKITLDDTTLLTTSFDEEIADGKMQFTMGTSSDASTLREYIRSASNIAVFLNSEPLPVSYSVSVNREVYSEIGTSDLLVITIVLAAVYAIALIFMIIKYKKLGLIGALSCIGYIAILLLLVRYANVKVSISGIMALFGTAVLEYVLLTKLIKTQTSDLDNEAREKKVKKVIKQNIEILIPILIISIVFSLTQWQPITSMGMILFWTVLEMLIYNTFNAKIICKKEGK